MRRIIVIAVLAAGGTASAQPASSNDGFCDFVEGVAQAEAALLQSPTVFAEIGRIEQPSNSAAVQDVGDYRFIGGIKYRLTGLYEGSATRARARAECRRHEALEQIRGQTLYRALDAKAKVIDGAFAEADKILAAVNADFEARRTTAPEATATKLRVEELHRISSDAHTQMNLLPAPTGTLGGLAAFQQADGDVEEQDAKLRKAKAIDLSIRVGVDPYLDATNNTASPFFAVLSLDLNIGVLFQGKYNDKAAAGRRQYVRSGRDPLTTDATAERLKTLLEAATKRSQETAALEADLQRQLDALARIGGDESRRYRQTVWFDFVKIKAEHAYNDAYVAALKQVLGGA